MCAEELQSSRIELCWVGEPESSVSGDERVLLSRAVISQVKTHFHVCL